jgi:hypothetical protein
MFGICKNCGHTIELTPPAMIGGMRWRHYGSKIRFCASGRLASPKKEENGLQTHH